jgi:hypothetical protein
MTWNEQGAVMLGWVLILLFSDRLEAGRVKLLLGDVPGGDGAFLLMADVRGAPSCGR